MQEDICESKASLIYTMYVPSQLRLQSKTRSQISKQIKKPPPPPFLQHMTKKKHMLHPPSTTGLHRTALQAQVGKVKWVEEKTCSEITSTGRGEANIKTSILELFSVKSSGVPTILEGR